MNINNIYCNICKLLLEGNTCIRYNNTIYYIYLSKLYKYSYELPSWNIINSCQIEEMLSEEPIVDDATIAKTLEISSIDFKELRQKYG